TKLPVSAVWSTSVKPTCSTESVTSALRGQPNADRGVPCAYVPAIRLPYFVIPANSLSRFGSAGGGSLGLAVGSPASAAKCSNSAGEVICRAVRRGPEHGERVRNAARQQNESALLHCPRMFTTGHP